VLIPVFDLWMNEESILKAHIRKREMILPIFTFIVT